MLAPLSDLGGDSAKLDPSWFNDSDHYGAATQQVLDTVKEALAAMALPSAWEGLAGSRAQIGCALVSSRRALAHGMVSRLLRFQLIRLSLERLPEPMRRARMAVASAKAKAIATATAPEAEAEGEWRLCVAHYLLEEGAPPPWPAVLLELATGNAATDAAVQASCALALPVLAVLVKPFVQDSLLAVGSDVLAFEGQAARATGRRAR